MLTDVGTPSAFHRIDACLALCSGMTTIAGSFVAAGKLHQLLPQRPIVLSNHSRIINILLGIMLVALCIYNIAPTFLPWFFIFVMFATGALFGIVFTIRVGGADMPSPFPCSTPWAAFPAPSPVSPCPTRCSSPWAALWVPPV